MRIVTTPMCEEVVKLAGIQNNIYEKIDNIELLLKDINEKLDKIINKKNSYIQEDDNLYML